jgi:hypothetical protein
LLARYSHVYTFPRKASLFIRVFFLACLLASVSTWYVIVHAVGWSRLSASDLLPLVLGVLVYALVSFGLLQHTSRSARVLGLDLPEPDELTSVRVLMRVTGASAQVIFRNARLMLTSTDKNEIELRTEGIYLDDFNTLICLYSGDDLYPVKFDNILLVSHRNLRGKPRRSALLNLRDLWLGGGRAWFISLPIEVEKLSVRAGHGMLYILADSDHPLFHCFKFTVEGNRLAITLLPVSLVLDMTCAIKDRTALLMKHPVLAVFARRQRARGSEIPLYKINPAVRTQMSWRDLARREYQAEGWRRRLIA